MAWAGPPIISRRSASPPRIAAPLGLEGLLDALRVNRTAFLLITSSSHWVSKEETEEKEISCRRRPKTVTKYAGDHYHHR